MRQRLRVGLVGGGTWAQHVHAPMLAAHPDWDLVGVWTRRPEAAHELAAANETIAFDDVAALIDAVDAVALSVPPSVQEDIAVMAAGAGRHVILEKPVAASMAGAERLAAAISTAGVASIVFLTFRFAPETRQWLDAIAGGGPWRGGNARWLSGGLLGGEYAGSAWRQENGAILDIGPHLFDLLDAAVGPIIDVRAAVHVEPDLWHAICEHESGAVSTATLSMGLAIHPSILDFDVYGDTGREAVTPRQTPPEQCYATLLDELAEMVRSGTTDHPCDVHRGVHLQRVIERVRDLAGR